MRRETTYEDEWRPAGKSSDASAIELRVLTALGEELVAAARRRRHGERIIGTSVPRPAVKRSGGDRDPDGPDRARHNIVLLVSEVCEKRCAQSKTPGMRCWR
jgi:hypothetical protein